MSRIYLDACMVIDLVEGEARYQKLLSLGIRGKRVVGSELLRLEARVKALRDNQRDYLERYDAFFNLCELIPFDRALFECATQLRVEHRIKTPDALHLAAAIQSDCDEFWSNDLRLLGAVSGHLKIVDWDFLGASI